MMIKKIGILLVLLACLHDASGQTVSGIGFHQVGQKIVVNYNIVGAKFYQKFNTELFVSMDGGKTFDGPLKEVSGDIGPGIETVNRKTVVWEVLKERPDFGGSVVFDVRARVIEEEVPNKFYIGYKGTLSAPLGMIMGMTGKTGFYASVRMNPGYMEDYTYHTDGESITDYAGDGYYSFTGNIKKRRFSVTAGLQFQVSRSMHIYVGGGYGMKDILYEIDQFEYSGDNTGLAWVKHEGASIAGFEAESGLMLELGTVYLSAGVSSPELKWVEPGVSVGVVF